jgi:hypothetical protein
MAATSQILSGSVQMGLNSRRMQWGSAEFLDTEVATTIPVNGFRVIESVLFFHETVADDKPETLAWTDTRGTGGQLILTGATGVINIGRTVEIGASTDGANFGYLIIGW